MAYIELEALRKSLLIGAAYLDEDTMMTVVNVLDCFPSADVAPVRHEKWEPHFGLDGKKSGYWMCSDCARTERYKTNFCPNCGAKMDGGDSNEQS